MYECSHACRNYTRATVESHQKIAMLRSATFAQLRQISGCFSAVMIFHFGEIWGQIGPPSTHNLSFRKYVAACPKIATSCIHTYSHSQCHWARVARLMTLLRSLQYSLSLSSTKTLFPKISNFCTSLGLYNIDRRCFVVRRQNLPKYQRT